MRYYRFNMGFPIDRYFSSLEAQLRTHRDYPTCVNFVNTKGLTEYDVKRLQYKFPSIQIRIAGGYSDEKISRDNRDYLKYDNIYTPDEVVKILREIDKIENGLNPNWTKEQKLFYFIGYLKNKIIYHPDFENQPSKEIRSLTGLFTHKTVCAGYSLILKELCDRNGIECDYVTGFTHKDSKTGKLSGSHAWNLIHFDGNVIPLDLTWNAGRNYSGKFMDISDIANVNEFMKNHIPGADEPIQDYTTLKSLDGNYVRGVYGLVNKTLVYDTTKFNFQRKDGSKFSVTLVDQQVHNNECVYTYVYNRIMPGEEHPYPYIFRCGTNIPGIHANIEHRERAKKDLEKARRSGDTARVKELEEKINNTKYFDDCYSMIADVLFSKENIIASSRRKDMYLGHLSMIKDQDDKTIGIKGVEVDPNFGKEITKFDQKIYTRSDGTRFILEKMTPLMKNKQVYTYRYRMYESILNEEGKHVIKKNTIITDTDLFLDNRQNMVDDFLARDRIDRKEKESSGYLGYYSKEGHRTYDPDKNKAFSKDMYKSYTLTEDSIIDYYPDLTFNDMKRLVQTFKTSDGTRVVNLRTGKEVTDKKLITHFLFANLWLHSASSKYYSGDPVPGFKYAFNEGSEKIFNYVTSKITESINQFGYIDSVDILTNVSNDPDSQYKYAEEIIAKLFATPWSCNIVNNLYRMQNPGALKMDKPIQYFGLGQSGMGNALRMISNRTADNAEREKQIIDVTYEDGNVVMKGR